jgi:hypothetical protein
MEVTDTLAYQEMATITALKSFSVQAPGFVMSVKSSFTRPISEADFALT